MLDETRHRAAADRAVAAMASAHRLLDPAAERLEIEFDGITMYGNLRRPPGADRPPLVLLIAGLDSTKEEFFAAENVLLARGLATFSLDGPGQGETGYASTIRPDFEAPVAAALDVLGAGRDLDSRRVGMLGVSLGGYFAARAAAFESRIRALVISGGPYDFGALIRDRPAHSVATLAHNSGTSSLEETYAFAEKLSLAGVLHRLTQPMIVVFGKLDRLVPWPQAVQVADEAPGATLWMFDEGNHVCMNMTYRWRPQAADWLAERLAGRGLAVPARGPRSPPGRPGWCGPSSLFGHPAQRGTPGAPDVPPGRGPGPGGVVGDQRVDDLGVLAHRPGRPPGHRQGGIHAPAQHLLQEILGHGQEPVVRILGDLQMQPGVHHPQLLRARLGPHRLLMLLERDDQAGQLLIAGRHGGPARGRHLQHLAHGEQLLQADFPQPGEPLQGPLALVGCGHEHALAVPDPDQPAGFQRAQRLTDGRPAHPEQLAQLAFPRKPVTRGQPVTGHEPLDLLRDPQEQRLAGAHPAPPDRR